MTSRTISLVKYRIKINKLELGVIVLKVVAYDEELESNVQELPKTSQTLLQKILGKSKDVYSEKLKTIAWFPS